MSKLLIILLNLLFAQFYLSESTIYVGSQTLQSSNDITITVTINTNTNIVNFEYTGPTDRWFACGFGSTTMPNTYAIYHTPSSPCLERKLGNDAKGSLLDSTTTTISDEESDDVRTVICERDIDIDDNDYYSFSNIGDGTTINVIWARGSSSSFSSHSNRGSKTITFEIDVPEPTMIPTSPTR